MSFKKTIIFSILLHLCFFAAVVLLPAGLLGNGNKIPREKVFFVNLAKDTGESGNGQSAVNPVRKEDFFPIGVKIKKLRPEKFRKIKVETEKAITVNPVSKEDFLSHRVNTDAVSEENDFSMERKPEGKVLLVNDESNGEKVFDISFRSEAGHEKISEGNKRRGILPERIFEIIRNSIERAKTYPVIARKRGIEGTVYISFKINAQGKPQEFKILKSSGSNILDTATRNIVKRAAPFPYVDSPVEVPVVFRLN